MARDGFLILDSDLHMMEPDDLWSRFLEGAHRANPPRFFGGQQRKLDTNAADKGNADAIMGMEVQGLAIPAHANASGATASSRELRRRSRARHPHFQVARAAGFDADSTLTAMDIEGVDVAVMYGTRGRQILMHDDLAPDYAAALARAYNNWAADYCQKQTSRLKFAAQVAMHDIPSAIAEARRCVKELGAVGIIGTPNPVNGQHLHDEACDPLWSALEELNVPVGFHPTGNTSLKEDAGRRYVGHANFHPIAHAIRNPVELMGAIASMTTGGILERHPGCAAPFSKAPRAGCTGGSGGSTTSGRSSGRAASTSSRCCRASTSSASATSRSTWTRSRRSTSSNKMGADYFVCSTDYPHSDGAFPEAMEQFFGLPFSADVRRKILWENCARLYNLATPAAGLTKDTRVSATLR
jgi:2,3-dihydroxybenzoate decarboxylase